MALTGVLLLASTLASVAGRSLIVAVATPPQVNTADAIPSTAMERALVEHACRFAQRPGTVQDAYERCLAARLQSLRDDFGPDLSRLSAAARAKIDAACAAARELRGHDDYLECLSGQLASLSVGYGRATAPPQAGAAIAAADAQALPASPSGAKKWSLLAMLSAAVAVVAVFVVAALGFVGVRNRPARHVCRACGGDVTGAADLCAACRHAAAEAIRQAASERAGALTPPRDCPPHTPR